MSQPSLARPYAVPRAMPRVYALPCRAPTQRPPARLACCIVALAAVSWALAARQPGRIAGSVSRTCWPCPGLAVFLSTQSSLSSLGLSQYNVLYCDTSLLSLQACLSPNCIAIQLPAHPAYCNTIFPAHCTPNLQYNNCITIQFQAKFTHLAIQSHSLLSCFLQYNFNIAIQTFLSQYNLGSSLKTVLHNFFFSI